MCDFSCCRRCFVAQIRCSWYKLCIAAKDATIYPHVVDMLSTQGRMKVSLKTALLVLQACLDSQH